MSRGRRGKAAPLSLRFILRADIEELENKTIFSSSDEDLRHLKWILRIESYSGADMSIDQRTCIMAKRDTTQDD